MNECKRNSNFSELVFGRVCIIIYLGFENTSQENRRTEACDVGVDSRLRRLLQSCHCQTFGLFGSTSINLDKTRKTVRKMSISLSTEDERELLLVQLAIKTAFALLSDNSSRCERFRPTQVDTTSRSGYLSRVASHPRAYADSSRGRREGEGGDSRYLACRRHFYANCVLPVPHTVAAASRLLELEWYRVRARAAASLFSPQ
jgi:hypothetical protein